MGRFRKYLHLRFLCPLVWLCLILFIMSKRSGRTTQRQFEIMVDYLTNHRDLVYGKLSSTFTAIDRDVHWKNLTVMLNNDYFGPKKTAKKWKRTWTDLKSEVKTKIVLRRKQKTGGRPPLEVLSPLYMRVADLIRSIGIESNSEVGETGRFLLDQHQGSSSMKNINSSVTHMHATVKSEPLEVEAILQEPECEEPLLPGAINTPSIIGCDSPPVNNCQSDTDCPQSTINPIEPSSPLTLTVLRSGEKNHRRKNILDNNHIERLVAAEERNEVAIKSLLSELKTINALRETELNMTKEHNIALIKLKSEKLQIEKERNCLLQGILQVVIKKFSV